MVLKEKVFRNKCLIKPVSASEQTAEPTTNNVILNTEELQSNTVDNSDDNSDVVENDVEVENNNTDEISDHDSSNNIEEAVKDVSIEQVQPEVEDNKLKLVNEHSIEEDIEEVVSNTSDSLQEDAMDVTDDNNAESLAKSEDQMTEPETVDNESLIINTEPLEKNTELSEINLVMPEDKETVQLKKPDEVYLEIYKEVKRRAKEAKKRAIEAYLEAKRIKSLYLLDEIESSDDESELLEMTVN